MLLPRYFFPHACSMKDGKVLGWCSKQRLLYGYLGSFLLFFQFSAVVKAAGLSPHYDILLRCTIIRTSVDGISVFLLPRFQVDVMKGRSVWNFRGDFLDVYSHDSIIIIIQRGNGWLITIAFCICSLWPPDRVLCRVMTKVLLVFRWPIDRECLLAGVIVILARIINCRRVPLSLADIYGVFSLSRLYPQSILDLGQFEWDLLVWYCDVSALVTFYAVPRGHK